MALRKKPKISSPVTTVESTLNPSPSAPSSESVMTSPIEKDNVDVESTLSPEDVDTDVELSDIEKVMADFAKKAVPESTLNVEPDVVVDESTLSPVVEANVESNVDFVDVVVKAPKPKPKPKYRPEPAPKTEPVVDDYGIPRDFNTRNFSNDQALTRHKVSEMITLIDLGEVDSKSIEQLTNVCNKYKNVDFDEEFDVRDELSTMMKMVHAVRSSIMTPDNQIARDTSISEVKAVIDASVRLATLLTKSNKELINMDRIKAVESSFLQVIGGMPTEVQKQYVENLENRMKLLKELTQLN